MMAQDSTEPTGIAGKPGGHDRPGNSVSRARNRKANAALELWIQGVDPETICKVVGYPTPRAVRVAVELALEKNLHETDKAILRDLASRQLQAITQGVMGKALNPSHPEHLVAAGRAADLISRWTKLHGLDAPTEHIVYNPTTAQIDQFVALVTGHGMPDVIEGDVYEAEIIEEPDAAQAG